MKVVGNRLLVRRIEEQKKAGEFETVEVQDSFVCKGEIVQVGMPILRGGTMTMSTFDVQANDDLAVGNHVLFAKYSPDTQEVEVDGEKMKVVALQDLIAIL